MGERNWTKLVTQLAETGVEFSPGLTDTEVGQAEHSYGLRFPPDLRALLQTAVPIGIRFPDWRSLENEHIKGTLGWPLNSFMFDVEHNEFWLPEWGPRPDSLSEALQIATAKVGEAPRLIPIYAHRYISESPNEAGNPIFSVYQTDIMYYGFDLDDYLRHEFKLGGRKPWPETLKPTIFWDPDRFQQIRW